MFRTGSVPPVATTKAARSLPSRPWPEHRFQSADADSFPLRSFAFMRIVVDVMGGDHGCQVVIEGVKVALQTYDTISELYLVGDEAQIRPAMTKTRLHDGRIKIVHTDEVLAMDDKPLDVLRRKKGCSMARALDLVREKKGEV